MDAQTLSKAMGGALPIARYEAILPAFNAAMVAAGITTPLRAAYWCSQLGHESGGLRWMEEIASGAAYEGRADLGNTQPGDGARFKGRGPIQVTGRYNYTAVSKWAHGKGLVPTATYFVDNPTQLASDQYGFIGPIWYWTVARPGLNALCDVDDVVGVTKAINGGTNGLADRKARLATCKALGAALLPDTTTEGGTTMAYYDIDWSSRFNFGGPRSLSGIQRIVIHTTENPAGTPAENVANYQINSQSGSYHVLVDTTGKRLRENTDDWVTWSTGNNAGNVQGVNLSFVAQAAWTRTQWLAQEKMLRAGATVVAYWSKAHNIPVAKVTTGRGVCGHGDLRAFGGTDHTDPGPNFPWDVFLSYVNQVLAGGGTTTPKGDTLSAQAEKRIELMLDQIVGPEKDTIGNYRFTGWPQLGGATLVDFLVKQDKKIDALTKAVADLKGGK